MAMELRPELLPPVFDEAKIIVLADLANKLDGCRQSQFEDCQGMLEQFKREAGTTCEFEVFQGVYGAMNHDEFVRILLSSPYEKVIPDITYDELLEIITRVYNAQGSVSHTNFWISLLEKNLPDPRISELIYWPDQYFNDDQHSNLSPKEMLDIALAVKPSEPIALPPSSLTN